MKLSVLRQFASPLALTIAACAIALPALAQTALAQPAATEQEYRAQAIAEFEQRKNAAQRPDKARNVIVFIGDGMGVSTITAARIFAGQMQGLDGESHVLAMDRMDHSALIKTYSHDAQVSDSAATATAIFAGTKTRSGAIGVGPAITIGDCVSAQGQEVPSLIGMAQQAGLATGVVTTTTITHATPAAAYGHTPMRNWESDADMSAEARAQGCHDLARQLVEGPVGSRLDVIMGGGRRNFLPETAADPEHDGVMGKRMDGRDLTAEWRSANPAGLYAWNAGQLAQYDPAGTAPLLALFEPGHMQYEADRANDPAGEPSLTEMVELALARLSHAPQGYVLLVEGGRIDHAHHASNAHRALADAVALDNAIARTMELVDLDDTLVLITADHSHTLTISGYPARGNPIFGSVAGTAGTPVLAQDGKEYTTLSYANGPGGVHDGHRHDPADVDSAALDYRQQATVPLSSETHAGEDVALLASGPGAHLFRGTMEQHTIFYVMQHTLLGQQ